MSWNLRGCGAHRMGRIGALLALTFAAAGIAQAQSAGSDSLTWKGITFYGVVDIGLQYETHGVPSSDYFPAGTETIIQKNSQGSVTAVTPSNIQQSRLGLAGNEPLIGDWAGVFRLEIPFNPQSGNISDGLKSMVLNNGRAVTAQTTNVDTSLAGQLFGSAAYIGLASPTYGSFTWGRQVTNLADGIAKYDPNGAAQAFSLIGFSGTTAGGGDTEDRRLDQSLKYVAKYGWLHLGGLYQFSGASGSVNTGYQLQLGADYAGFSFDAYYFKKYNAVAAGPLSPGQAEELAGKCNPAVPPVPPPANGAQCFSIGNSLSGTISDNKTWAAMALYDFGTVKLYGAYERIAFDNPNTPWEPGQLIIGGYVLAFTNNKAYTNERVLQVFWGGVKWGVTKDFDLIAAYYGYKQNSFATGADAGCGSRVSSGCSGTEDSFSIVGDYRLSKRFDVFLGTFYTGVHDGLAAPAPPAGFFQTSTLATTAGIRFKF